MQLIFHGGAYEVGRSCIELKTAGDRYLLDCGLKFHEAGFDYPAKVFEIRELDGVFITHAHLDHSGGLPFFEHYSMICPIFCTTETEKITKILLEDSHKIARIKHLHEAFTNVDMKNVYAHMTHASYNKEVPFRTLKFTLLNAGHIPGSSSVKIEAEGLKVLYTGDYNTRTTQLMQPADPHTWGDIDVMITECTYGARELPDRERLEAEFLSKVTEVIARGGRVLIPVFAVGRAQEILVMLAKRSWSVPIFMDGMAKKVTRAVIEGNSPYVLNKERITTAFNSVEFVASDEHRTRVASHAGIFLTTSGMLQGGPAIHYLEQMWHDEKSAVLLTGYQVKGTNGWMLNNEKTAYIGGYRTRVKCEIERFDFSGHLSSEDIKSSIIAARPKILVLNHGNEENINAILEWAKKETNCQVFAPKVGEMIELNPGSDAACIKVYDEPEGKYVDEHQHSGEHNHEFHDE